MKGVKIVLALFVAQIISRLFTRSNTTSVPRSFLLIRNASLSAWMIPKIKIISTNLKQDISIEFA